MDDICTFLEISRDMTRILWFVMGSETETE